MRWWPLTVSYVMEERAISVCHSSINRWTIRFLPLIEKMARKHKRPVGGGWRMDETYSEVKGVWKYLYRAVDKQGKTVVFPLAAKRLFDKVMDAMSFADQFYVLAGVVRPV